MVKLSAEIISPIIADLFNMSLHTGKFPTTWKTSLVTSIYKKGNIYNISNYRPISILSIVSKLCEKLIERRIRDFVESNGILSKYQHGFRTKRSCQTALLSLTNILFSNRNNKQISAISALDFSKAFDCMHHSILLNRLSDIGFGKLDIIWMDSYLSQRQQRVIYNGVLSDYRAISRGIPQGSSLALLLFILYLDSLLCGLPDGSALAYANDVSIISTGKSATEAKENLQNLLHYVSIWAVANGLSLNLSKCFVMFIPSSPCKTIDNMLQVELSGQALLNVDKLTMLGVTITHDLQWSSHGNKVRANILIPNVKLMLLLMCALLANIMYDLLGNLQVINLFYLNLPRLKNNVFYTVLCETGTIYQTT